MVIQGALEMLAYELRTDSVEVTCEFAAGLPPLWADSHQLHQVLVNLIANAHHAMRKQPRPAPRRIRLASQLDREHERVRLTVADTGPGIAPEIREKIFEPFFTTKPAGEGTGLGLSLCRGIIEEHGGTISIQSEPGQGATFVIELPLVERATAEAARPAMETLPLVGARRVLVVDDEVEIAHMLKEILTTSGHEVDMAFDGAEALDVLRRTVRPHSERHQDADARRHGLLSPAHQRVPGPLPPHHLPDRRRPRPGQARVSRVHRRPVPHEAVRRGGRSAPGPSSAGRRRARRREVTTPEAGSKRVVVVDDDAELRSITSEYLRSHGVEVIEATNGLEALLYFMRSRPAAVVLDLQMPRLGGLDALKRMVASDPAVHVVVVTGAANGALRPQAIALGAKAALAKPAAPPDILSALPFASSQPSTPGAAGSG